MPKVESKLNIMIKLKQLGIKPKGLIAGRVAKLSIEHQEELFEAIEGKKYGGDIRYLKNFITTFVESVKIDELAKENIRASAVQDKRKIHDINRKAAISTPITERGNKIIQVIHEATAKIQFSPSRYLGDSDESTVIRIGKFTIEKLNKPYENASQALNRKIIEDVKEFQLKIYRKIYKDKTDDELIEQLSLNEADMEERLLKTDQLQIVRDGEIIVGVTSSKLIKYQDEYCLYIPYTMISPNAQGRKLHVRMVAETGERAANDYVLREEGKMLRGFWHLLTKGLPLIVRTQSISVAMDIMMRASKYFIPFKGANPDSRTLGIIKRMAEKLGSTLGNDLIFRNVYNGKINLESAELVQRITKKLPKPLQELFMQLGEKDAIPVVGYFTSVSFEKLKREMKKNEKEMKKEMKEEHRKIYLQV